DELSVPFFHFFERGLQKLKLEIASNKWRSPYRLARFKPACATASEHAPHTDRLRMTFDFVLAQVRKFKQLSKQPSCAWRHEHLIWFRDLLQPCRQVRRFTNQREFPTGTLPDQITHHYKSSRNADPHLDPRRTRERQFRYSFDRLESGLNRALGVVLVRGR